MLLVFLLYMCVGSWSINVKNSIDGSFFTSSIAVFRNRAFLTLPRSSCYNNLTNPTLIEIYWNSKPSNVVNGRIKYFSDSQEKCANFQDAVSVDVDVKKYLLWVLDRGSKKCPPKVLIYNLISNKKVYSLVEKVSPRGSFLVVDPAVKIASTVYVGNSENNKLLVITFKNGRIQMNEIQVESEKKIFTERLAVSRTSPTLYITKDDRLELFAVDLTTVRNYVLEKKFSPHKINATFLGDKLGPSGGLTTDLGGGLDYFLTQDFAILRWRASNALKAENHDVLEQSAEFYPYISHMFTVNQDIWALVNPGPPEECRTTTKRVRFWKTTDLVDIESRFVRLLRIVTNNNGEMLLVN